MQVLPRALSYLVIYFKEAAVLRRKAEELEQDRDSLKKQVKELTDKIASTTKTNTTSTVGLRRTTGKANNLAEEKVKVSNSCPKNILKYCLGHIHTHTVHKVNIICFIYFLFYL